MARQSFISTLTLEDRQQLNNRLRTSLYSDQAKHLAWLHSLSYDVSKSGLSRYVVALREADGLTNKQGNELAARATDNVGLSRKESILIEIGKMRIREVELINEWNKLRD